MAGVSYVAPVSAALVGWLLLGEPVGFPAAAGFTPIVASFAHVTRRSLPPE